MGKTEVLNRKLVFENGREFAGAGFGSGREALCQCSFDTAMIGYQEILSDPACAGEGLVMTYPVIGSYGMADEDYESRACHAECLIVRQYNDRPSNFRYTKTLEEVMLENDIPGIQGLDTRAVSRMLRDQGSMKALLTDISTPKEQALERLKSAQPEQGLAAKASSKKIWYSRTANFRYNVAAVDFGIRQSSIRCLNSRGCNVTIVPWDIGAEQLEALKPDGLFLSSGPGDPKECAQAIELVRTLWGKLPIFGVGLGYQILALAAGGDTYKMKNGHNGGNVPVETIYGPKREITSQSHSYAVCEKSLENTGLKVTHRHLTDRTVEGVIDEASRAVGVQHYPENQPGADDCAYVYDQFIAMMDKAKEGGKRMPKRTDIKKILVIGSGPIVIGQAAEFDYSGTQACLALKEEGYQVILVNSNPATIMTDSNIADKVYMEPLNLEYVARIIRMERPDALIPTLGGQTGLNLAMQLAQKGVLRECNVEILGADFDSIDRAEDREKFKDLCLRIGEPVLDSAIAHSVEQIKEEAERIGYPIVLRPAFTLGGTGGGFCDDEEQLLALAENALNLSPVHQVLVEKSIKGYKEIEFEVMRDKNDTAIAICSMENIDPVGVHTGDSMVVAPAQTLTAKEYHMLRDAALRIIRELGIEGGCNVQFALDPYSFRYYVIEVNPRVSRSSALASKASGYPIAKVTTKVAVGLALDEIQLGGVPASFEPSLDYIVCKVARFPFDKFDKASKLLTTQMKATGEIMAIGRTMEESLLKAVRSLEAGVNHVWKQKFDGFTTDELMQEILTPTDERLYAIAELLRRKVDLMMICQATKIDYFFIDAIRNIVDYEQQVKDSRGDAAVLRQAKRMGFSDAFIGKLWDMGELDVLKLRQQHDIWPVYKTIDTCAGEFDAYVPYFYSTYEEENESIVTDKPSVLVLGSGPIRIGQGVEFDYSTVHAIWAIREAGYEAIIINNNPETVSTDYTVSDKLYFEPLCVEDVMNLVHLENPMGVVVSLGGQTAINLAERLHALGVKIIGTGVEAIDKAENRDSFEKLMEELKIPQPAGQAVTRVEDGIKVANQIGYPVLVRPSYVLGGRAMQIVRDDQQLRQYLAEAVVASEEHPVLVDKYIAGKELEVDAICDGETVLIPGIMEHVEHTGVHSGDSFSVYPTFSVGEKARQAILDYTIRLGRGIGIQGLFNIQFIVGEDETVHVIEVNPRSSRTVPFLSKATGLPLPKIATKVMLGHSLKEQGYETGEAPRRKRWYVKAPVFSFSKLRGADVYLSPEMKSTGEAIGYDDSLNRALYKALKAANMRVANYGTVFVTIADDDKPRALPLIRRFYNLGFNIEATLGTAQFLRENGIRTRGKKKISEGSEEILESLRAGHVTYVINTLGANEWANNDGFEIRRCAAENNVTMFTSLDTVSVLLDVLEEITVGVSTIDSEGTK